MSTVILEAQDNIAVVRFDNCVTNPVSSALVADLTATLEQVKSEFQGMVLAGGEKFFSMGLNLPELLEMDRQQFTEFWYAFNQSVLDLYTLPIPTVCALAGHAPAAGTIYAMACDFRFAAIGKKVIGLNEIVLGIPVPYLADMIMRQLAGDRVATELMYTGQLIPIDIAKDARLVENIVASDAVETESVKFAQELAAKPAAAFAGIKENRVEQIVARFQQNHQVKHEQFIDMIFTDETQELLKEAAKKF